MAGRDEEHHDGADHEDQKQRADQFGDVGGESSILHLGGTSSVGLRAAVYPWMTTDASREPWPCFLCFCARFFLARRCLRTIGPIGVQRRLPASKERPPGASFVVPAIASPPEAQLQEPESIVLPGPGVGYRPAQLEQGVTAGPDHELDHAMCAVEPVASSLRREALVVVVMSVEDDVRTGPVENAPEGADVLVLLVKSRGVARMVVGRENAAVRMAVEVATQPARLARSGPAAHPGAVRVEDDHVPASELAAVPAAPPVPGSPGDVAAPVEVAEVAARVGRLELVVARDRDRLLLEAAPALAVGAAELGERTVRVLEVSEGEARRCNGP